MELIILITVAVTTTTMCYISFHKEIHNQIWYIPLAITIGLFNNILWIFSTKYFTEEKKLYTFSLIWDIIFISIYYFLPLMFFNIKMDKYGWLGVILMTIGALIIKMKI
jgi:hypothetical protein